MSKQLFIPTRIKVGFNKRKDTYTEMLAYVIYYDLKNVLRKEKSWETWRDKKIDPVEYTNEPTEGFVLNKGVGGQRQSYGWNARNEYIRVYDPRNFEFEISVANLLFILKECDCSRGKGLEGKFVYAWDNTELVLLPAGSEDYKNSQKFTTLQDKGVKSKELIPGASYTTKRQEVLTYVGKYDFYSIASQRHVYHRGKEQETKREKHLEKQFVFWNNKSFVFLKDLKTIAVLNSDVVASNLADLIDAYYKSPYGSKPVKLFLKDNDKQPEKGYAQEWFYEITPGVFVECRTDFEYNSTKIRQATNIGKVYLNENVLFSDNCYSIAYPPGARGNFGLQESFSWREPTNKILWVELESGSQFQYRSGFLMHRS